MRSRVAAALGTLLLLSACAPDHVVDYGDRFRTPHPALLSPSPDWREIGGSPLSPRTLAVGLWTGREVLFVGGSDMLCPESASCVADPTPFLDAAALDPVTGLWRPTAPAPKPVVQGVVIGRTAYLGGEVLLEYRPDGDTWSEVPTPFDAADYTLAAAGDLLVAYRSTDEAGPGPDHLFDTRTGRWTTMPADPLGNGFDRHLTWSGREVVLFDHELVPNPGSGPMPTRAAAFNPSTGKWRRLPDLPMLATSPWIRAGGELVNPTPGYEDGGQVNGWGRNVPYGGRVNVATGDWSPLPPLPNATSPASGFTDREAVYADLPERMLDISRGAWRQVPSIPGRHRTGGTVVAAGRLLVIFGGQQLSAPGLDNLAWTFHPR